FHYGSYEREFLRRMRKQSRRKRLAERVLANAVNVLSVVHASVYYRRLTDGRVNARCLKYYLILLSVYLTCKFRGVSFLKFLLSEEKDVEKFCRGARKKHKPSVPVYPKGFPRQYPNKRKRPTREESQQ